MTVSKDVEAVKRDGRSVGAGIQQHVILFFPPNKLFLFIHDTQTNTGRTRKKWIARSNKKIDGIQFDRLLSQRQKEKKKSNRLQHIEYNPFDHNEAELFKLAGRAGSTRQSLTKHLRDFPVAIRSMVRVICIGSVGH